ncbi:MAG: UDP-N-acetylmuramate dehydrogenase [Elusimicrobia bacterium]|nr:UDP-N-acetylmuramate dehydrogenase [Elusimicrobiota bacterium]
MCEKYKEIKERFGQNWLPGYSAAAFTTYRAGGPFEALVTPAARYDLAWLRAFCARNDIPFRVLGAGSNVLVSDKGLKGVTAVTSKLDKVRISGHTIEAEAGALWDDVARISVENSLGGLEKTSGIPGTAGGAVFMNAGAFGQEIFDALESFETMDSTGYVKTLRKAGVKYGYRKVEGIEGLIILSAVFNLQAGDRKGLLIERNRVLAQRAEKQPLEYPSAGSVFKRPPGDFAARLIDAAGLKGLRVGDAEVSRKHAGFIINLGNATASDIYALMQNVRAEVKDKAGVDLEPEQLLLGDFE